MTPRLRFPEFTDEWQVKKLGDVVMFSRGNLLSKADLDDNGVYKAIHYGQLFTIYNEVIGNIISRTNVNTGKTSAKGDLLMPTSDVTPQGLARASVVHEDGVMLGGDINVLSPIGETDSNFLSYLLNSQKKKIMRLVTGTTVRHVYASDLCKASYSFSQKLEQEKIAEFLTAVDERIVAGEKKLELLQRYKKGVMQKIFAQQIRFQDENGNLHPEWKDKPFGEVFKFLRTNSLPRAELQSSGNVMNIHYGDIHMKLGSHFDATKDKVMYLRKSIIGDSVQNGDLIIADASEDRKDVGKSTEMQNIENLQLVAGLHTFLARPKGMAIGFSGYLMQSSQVRSHLWRIATGASVLGISKTELAKIKISIPSHEEQQKITTFLAALDDKIAAEQTRLTAAKQWKKGLLQRMFV